MEGIKEARVSARIDQLTKTKAEKELSKHGLSISEFIRMNLTTVANKGLPDYYGMPNETTMAAIYDMIDTVKNQDKIEAISFDDIQKLFDEWGNKLIIGYSKQFKKDVKKIQHNNKWKRILKKPLPFSNLTPWEYVIKSFEDDKELPDYFYSQEITFPKIWNSKYQKSYWRKIKNKSNGFTFWWKNRRLFVNICRKWIRILSSKSGKP